MDVVALNDADHRRRVAEIARLEEEGYRIVTGGQTRPYGEDGDINVTTFEMRDWRTNELLFEGRGTLDDYDRLCDEHDPEDRWFHIDNIDNITSDTPPVPDGIPESLAQVLGDWAADNAADAHELVASSTVE